MERSLYNYRPLEHNLIGCNMIYLAGGMEYTNSGKSWRTKASSDFKKYGFKVWNPYEQEGKVLDGHETPISYLSKLDKITDFEEYRSIMSRVVLYDMDIILRETSALFVKYDPSVTKGAGTHAEISYAHFLKIPIFVWLAHMSLDHVPSWAIGCFDNLYFSYEDAKSGLISYMLGV